MMTTAKAILASSAGCLFGIANPLLLRGNSIVVLVYHDITEEPSEFSRKYGLNVTPETFEYQIKFIKNEFNIISPKDLDRPFSPTRSVLITFDDGFKSVIDNALPILEKYRVPSVLFLNAEPITGKMFWGGLITYLCEYRADFVKFLKENIEINTKAPLFLSCRRDIVERFLQQLEKPIERDVNRYVGPFATEQDLTKASNSLMFYGNHLYNHYVPIFLSDEELLKLYFKNENILKSYPNYLGIFSFPFGQPLTCFRNEQIGLLKHHGVQRVFSSSGRINAQNTSYFLDRISLTSFHNTPSRIWFQLFRKMAAI